MAYKQKTEETTAKYPPYFSSQVKNKPLKGLCHQFRMGKKGYSWIGLSKTSGANYKKFLIVPFVFYRLFKFLSAKYQIHSKLPLPS
jgi:hypothetical protein